MTMNKGKTRTNPDGSIEMEMDFEVEGGNFDELLRALDPDGPPRFGLALRGVALRPITKGSLVRFGEDILAVAEPTPDRGSVHLFIAGERVDLSHCEFSVGPGPDPEPDPLVTVHASTVVAPGEVWLLAVVEGEPQPRALVVPIAIIGAGPWPVAFARYRMAFDEGGRVSRLSEP
jgi:hypothetical protein